MRLLNDDVPFKTKHTIWYVSSLFHRHVSGLVLSDTLSQPQQLPLKLRCSSSPQQETKQDNERRSPFNGASAFITGNLLFFPFRKRLRVQPLPTMGTEDVDLHSGRPRISGASRRRRKHKGQFNELIPITNPL